MIYGTWLQVKYFLCFWQSVTLPELPAVVVFKDGGFFTYDGECRATLSSAVDIFEVVVLQLAWNKN